MCFFEYYWSIWIKQIRLHVAAWDGLKENTLACPEKQTCKCPSPACVNVRPPLHLVSFPLDIWDPLRTPWSIPGFQWDVAVQDPAVMKMYRVLCAGGGRGGGRAGLAARGHGSPLQGVGRRRRLPATGAGVRRGRRRRQRSEGELVVWATRHIWNNKEKATKHTEDYYFRKIKTAFRCCFAVSGSFMFILIKKGKGRLKS